MSEKGGEGGREVEGLDTLPLGILMRDGEVMEEKEGGGGGKTEERGRDREPRAW